MFKKRESVIEKELVRRAVKFGGMAIKLTGYKGIPDRLVIGPKKYVFFAELKSPTGEVSEAQEVFHDKLRALGFPVAVISDYETLDIFLPE